MHEKETKSDMANLKQEDTYIKRRTGLSNSRIEGANNTSVNGSKAGNKVLNKALNKGVDALFGSGSSKKKSSSSDSIAKTIIKGLFK